MKRSTPRVLLPSLLAAVFLIGAAHPAAAQNPEPSGTFKPIYLKLPDGYMPAPFPQKRKGQLLLNAKRPSGMYMVYPKEGESAEAFNDVLKEMVKGMFFHDSNPELTWAESPLPSHKGVENEAGTLFTASDDKLEIQLAAYTRTLGETKVAYGYYAMRHKGGKDKDDGVFLDAAGNGVKEFEKFCQSMHLK